MIFFFISNNEFADFIDKNLSNVIILFTGSHRNTDSHVTFLANFTIEFFQQYITE